MNFKTLLVSALVTSSVLSTASAQFAYDPNIGTDLFLGSNAIGGGNPLGFSFTFPDGTVVTSIDIDSNGRILPPGGDTSDPSETINELLHQSSSICVLWDDLSPFGVGFGGVHFNAYHDGVNNIAVITWLDVVESGQSQAFTVQAVLREDNTMTLWWGPNVPTMDGIVGISAGNHVVDPGVTTFDCGPLLETDMASTVYAKFGSGEFDLAGSSTYWVRDVNTGGYLVFTQLSNPCPRTVLPTQARRVGRGCGGFTPPPVSIDFMPDGIGGYNVTTSTNTFDPDLGLPFGIPSGDPFQAAGGNTTATADLGFDFAMPGGTVVDAVVVDSNGRLITGGASDATPSRADLFNRPGGVIAPLWGNLDYSDPDSFGGVTYATNSIDYATVTWDGVVQFNGSFPLTMQVQLFGAAHPTRPNSWTFVYEDVGGIDVRGISANNWIMGCSDGVGPDPGEIDLSSLPIASAGNPNVFEEIHWFSGDQFDIVPPSERGLVLSFDTLPVIGTTFDLTLERIDPNATAAWMLLGFQKVGIDLSLVGAPCTLYSSAVIPALPMSYTPGSSTANFSIFVSGARGIPLVLQSVVVNIGANPLNVELSNAVTAVTGN